MESFNEVWDKSLALIRDRISMTSYESWIKLMQPIRFENGTAYLYAQSNFHKELITNKFLPEIERALSEVMGFDCKAEILSKENVGQKLQNQFQMNDVKDIQTGDERETGSFNEELTFENFVVGNENKFAHAASIAVANNPGGAYNPFFIYGRSGLGKTHLLCAIANEIRKNRPESKIMLVKGEDFTNEIIEAIAKGKQIEFRGKYRFLDVFLVDDIQFIGGKASTELEFFHTFDSLFEAKRQIILTSDRPPKEMPLLEDRLRSRFEQGLIADIQPPEFETRVAIIKRKAESINLDISNEIAEFIATKLKNNVRELEGAVKKIKAYSLIFNDKPSLGIIQNVIQSVIKENINTAITPESVVEHVSRYFNIPVGDIYGNKRKTDILNARQIAMYITRELTELSLSLIGEKFGGKNHSTVLHSIRQVETRLETDSKFNQTISEMMENIKKEF